MQTTGATLIIASYLVATATERRRWQRQQSTRWDVKRAEVYVDYGNTVKNVSYKMREHRQFPWLRMGV